MRRSGVTDYEEFAHKILETITDAPRVFEVFADEADEMVRQARLIASWGLTSTSRSRSPIPGRPTTDVRRELSAEGVHLNVTALMTVEQVEEVAPLSTGGPATSSRCSPAGSPTPGATRYRS